MCPDHFRHSTLLPRSSPGRFRERSSNYYVTRRSSAFVSAQRAPRVRDCHRVETEGIEREWPTIRAELGARKRASLRRGGVAISRNGRERSHVFIFPLPRRFRFMPPAEPVESSRSFPFPFFSGFSDTHTPFLLRLARARRLAVSHRAQKENFRGTCEETAKSGNPIVIYVPNRANRRVHGIGIQHRPGMRNRNLFSFPFPFPVPGAALPKYFITSPWSRCTSAPLLLGSLSRFFHP